MTGSRNGTADSRPLPRSFVLELTRRCNHTCSYCYTAWGAPELQYDPNGGESTVEEIEDIVARLQDETPVKQIALSGGEPMLRKDLARIVSFIAARGIDPMIVTNGSMLASRHIDDIVSRALFEVTLLSHRRDVHDAIVGRKGAWDSVVQGMTNLHERKGSYVAAFIATKQNCEDIRETAELAIALGAHAFIYNRMNLSAFNIRRAEELLPTAENIRHNLDTLEELSAAYHVPVSVSVVIEPCVIDVRKYKHLFFGWCPLAGENSYFTIDPAGNVRVCNHSPTILGNIKRERFADIYYRNDLVRRFRETLPLECVNCDPDLRSLCRGGCKAAAEQCYGTIDRVDPFVTMNRDHAV